MYDRTYDHQISTSREVADALRDASRPIVLLGLDLLGRGSVRLAEWAARRHARTTVARDAEALMDRLVTGGGDLDLLPPDLVGRAEARAEAMRRHPAGKGLPLLRAVDDL